MYTCVLCKFPSEFDDVVVGTLDGRCICLRCFHHEVGDERPLPSALRRLLEAALATSA